MMQEVFDKLRSLQDVLSKKFEIERDIVEIPKALTTKNELLKRLKKSYIEKNTSLTDSKNKLKSLRIRLADAENERENYEKQMDKIQTQREYEALDKEIKSATEKEQQLRKDILREEKRQEELHHALEREESLITDQEEELLAEEKKINEESKAKESTLDTLKKEELKIIPGLDDEILFKFERIIRSKSGIGIVPIQKSVCTGCHMVLPSQFQNNVRKGEEILFCPYCSRILFYEDTDQGMDIINDEEHAGSLSDLIQDDDFFDDED